MDSEEAWAKLKAVDAERDMDDIKEAFEVYAKNSPDVNFRTIEERSRAEKLNLHLVALEKVLPLNKTNVDLQGVADRRYAIGFQLSAKSRRLAMTATMLAASPEENLERLEECGYTVHSRVPVCFNVSLFLQLARDLLMREVQPKGPYRKELSRAHRGPNPVTHSQDCLFQL